MSEENKTIIRALNKYGRVPEQWELLNMIEDLENRIDKAIEYIKNNTYFKDNVVKTIIFKDFSDKLLEILGDKEIEEIPQFKGTLQELDNLKLGE